MAATRLIAMHHNKGKTLAQCLKERTDYAQNPEKTEKGNLVTAYECDPMTCDEEFLLAKRQYEHITGRRQQNDIIAYQIRQSFKPGEITPEEANAVGYELAMRFTKGKYAFIVATHTDRAHIHSHIIINSTSLDCTRKFRDFYFSGLAVQRLSDLICLEHGLSVIEKKPCRERVRYTDYPKWPSFRDAICAAIDEAMQLQPADFDALIVLLQERGYEYRPGKQPALRGPGQKRFIRFSSLGEGYSKAELAAELAGEADPVRKARNRSRVRTNPEKPKMSFLIDVQAKINEGKSGGYVQWAKVFNVKQIAQAMLFLSEHNVDSFGELTERADESASACSSLLDAVKADEKRLQEIAVLRKHIINYSKARNAFAEYKASGYNQIYFENHRELLTARREAKAAFDAYKREHGKDTPLPRVKELNAEYAAVLEHKKQSYAEYRKRRDEMREWQVARQIVGTVLNEETMQPVRDRQRKR